MAISTYHWKLNDNAANTTVVDSIDGKDGTANVNTDTIHVAGLINGALQFNGTSNYVSILDITDTLTAGTICFWVKPDSDSNTGWIIHSHTDGDTDYNWYFEMSEGGIDGILFLFNTGGVQKHLRASMTIPSASWTFVVGTWSASGSELFINTVSKDTDVSPALGFKFNMSKWTDTTMGCNWNLRTQENFPGAVDDVRIYNYVLTSNNIAALYNLGSGMDGELRVKTLSDNFLFSDTDTKIRTLGKVLTDILSLSDIVTITRVLHRALTDILSLSDTVVRKFCRSLTDTLLLSDTTAKKVSKILSDRIWLLDIIATALKIAGVHWNLHDRVLDKHDWTEADTPSTLHNLKDRTIDKIDWHED